MNRIALLIPVFQNQLGAEKSLGSLSEDVPLDIVLIDDGSSPPLEVPRAHPAHSIVLLRQPKNMGIAVALNAGLQLVFERNYEYVARLDAGDQVIAGRFAVQVEFLDSHPEIALVGTAVQYVREDGASLFVHRLPHAQTDIVRAMHRNTAFCHPSVMMRVAMIRHVGFYSETHFAEDYEYFYRIVDMHHTANLPDVLLVKEVAAASVSVSSRRRHLRSRLRIQIEHFRLRSFSSYLGLATTLALSLCPQSLVLKWKQWLWG